MRGIALLAAMLLAGCTTAAPDGADGDVPPPAPFANDPQQPLLALFEHVIGDYFALAGDDAPTTCAILRDGGEAGSGLTADQEEALLLRFPRLAPAGRCQWDGQQYADSITGDRATVIDIYQFACDDPRNCSGSVNIRGPGACRPAVQYSMLYAGDAWQFARSERLPGE
ncbi:hypothetical protein FHS61_003217 [Altererythrobacter atlanticus]|uniref:Uncharacterized protein n=1 Tax=Croceibacterium atlanticum TaxID=1267766 RepID=A0A0F7KRA5_9SPHN|nr:hypothetical protein [Croceibacterium atlanticum]AKH41320.1 hypothetical protein WYH_00256 [Croceibacterium atlanticum]MBB5734167.1 hypothetical protein [Croceibacterium atlanticum]